MTSQMDTWLDFYESAIQVAHDSGFDRVDAKEYAKKEILQEWPELTLNGSKPFTNDLVSAFWAQTSARINKYYKSQPDDADESPRKPTIKAVKKDGERLIFRDLYENIALETGKLPESSIGEALAKFLGYEVSIVSVTIANMRKRGWIIEKNGGGNYKCTPPEPPRDPIFDQIDAMKKKLDELIIMASQRK